MLANLGRVVAVVSVLASNPAAAGPKYLVQPVPVGAETARFRQGVPTLDLQLPDGVVQVSPLGVDHGNLVFGVVVFNDGKTTANIDITNFEVSDAAGPVQVLSRETLKSKAKSRAVWQSIAVAALAGASAAAAASQRDTYKSTLYTPRGTYRYVRSEPSAAGQVAAAASVVGGAVALNSIQRHLDENMEAIGDSVVQLTTVEPGESYGGRIVLARLKNKAVPQRLSFAVNWNGQRYPFAFQLAKKGTPQPTFAPPPPLPAAAELTEAPAPAATTTE